MRRRYIHRCLKQQGGAVSEILDGIWSWIVEAVGETSWREVMPLGIAGILVWALWLYRAVLSRFARPVINDFRTTVSVVVPAYREDPDILLECLDTWLAQDPDEVIIVPDVDGHRGARSGCAQVGRPAGAGDRRSSTGASGPRSGVGIRAARRARRARRLRHPLGAGPARRRADAVRRPGGRRRRHPAERLPAHDQHLAADRRLAGQPALLRLRAGDGPGRRGGLPVRPHGGLPARR